MRRLSLWLLVLLAVPALAQPMPAPAQSCEMGRAEAVLDGALVRARVFNNGNLFYGPAASAAYEVPRGQGVAAIFAQSFWLAGKVGGEVRAAGATFANFAFRPGQIGTDRTAPTPDECASADRIWRVARTDVERYERTGEATPDLAEWPVHLGAPVRDDDGVPGNYNLSGGDRPLLSGDVTAFWAMTDGATRPENRQYGGPPLGVDVTVEAFAFVIGQPALTSATFYRYRVTNRSGAVLDSLHAAMFVDFDIGDYSDDYVGTDTTLALHYVYNADNMDGGPDGYGEAPPAVGLMVLDSPLGADGRPVGLTATPNVRKNSPPETTQMPRTLDHVLPRMRGRYSDQSPMLACGFGFGCAGPATRFVYHGDPVTGGGWSERNPGTGAPNPGGDRYTLSVSGPITLAPDQTAMWLFAIPYGRGADHLDSVTQLRGSARLLQTAHAIGRLNASTPSPSPVEALPLAVAPPAPNPFAGSTTIRLRGLPDAMAFTLTVRDALGRVVERRPVPAGTTALEVGGSLAPGVYAVEIAAPTASARFRVVKTR